MNRSRLLIAVMALAASTATGWLARGWFEDGQRLTTERAVQQTIDAALERESTIARTVEARLAELEANERIIDRGIIHEIEKPIYRRVCLEPRLVRLLNDAATGRAPIAADTTGPLPGDSAAID
uniref:hypothetical protein n=1 Tax=Halomonas sp. TaxID=1486246 RepID=UPI002604D29E|nr:hypothetical protein [Halomonas sp.]